MRWSDVLVMSDEQARWEDMRERVEERERDRERQTEREGEGREERQRGYRRMQVAYVVSVAHWWVSFGQTTQVTRDILCKQTCTTPIHNMHTHTLVHRRKQIRTHTHT